MSTALAEAATNTRRLAGKMMWRGFHGVRSQAFLPPLCACGRFLAAEDRRDREQTLLTLAGTLVVVEKFEFTLAQLQDGHIGGRADVERAAVVERREDACGIDRAGRD